MDPEECSTDPGLENFLKCLTPNEGYYLSALATPTACTADQANCDAHATTCSTDPDIPTKLACATPADGFYLDNVATPTACTLQGNCAVATDDGLCSTENGLTVTSVTLTRK